MVLVANHYLWAKQRILCKISQNGLQGWPQGVAMQSILTEFTNDPPLLPASRSLTLYNNHKPTINGNITMKLRFVLPALFVLCVFAVSASVVIRSAQKGKTELSNGEPRTPREEQATFRVLKGFKVELAACEPQVVDPVALAFDERGRLFVAEMIGYPNEGVATGPVLSGRVRLLEDRDGDGFFEKSTVYRDKLRLPTSVMPYRGGLLVADAPDLLYLEDKDGDGKAEKKRVLYTGFDLSNIQQLPSALQWGLDNWVYACVGGRGGTVRLPEKKSFGPLVLRGRGIRFHPDIPGSLEPTSGGGQFGLTPTNGQQWFTATNSQHLRHIVLPDHYLRRNPLLPVRTTTIDIPDHGAACKVHRISKFEAWRVERTTRRKTGPRAKRFSPTELVPGGFITSACSPLVYNADLFPKEYRGQVFVCDPANNLIHRDILEPKGATFVAHRADANCEFLASTDNFFRPVNSTIGPDGAIYIADFYREVIETPLSLPDDIKKRVNEETLARGRIWRIVPDGKHKHVRPALDKASAAELVQNLGKANIWWRRTSQRLLVERQDKSAVKPLQKLLRTSKRPPARMHALWTLAGLKALTDADIKIGLRDASAGVREQALRLAEDRLQSSAKLRKLVAKMADDPAFRVRFQLAFTLGEAPGGETATALGKIVRRDIGDSWMQTAVLSSAHGKMSSQLLSALVKDKGFTHGSAAHLKFLQQLAALVSASPEKENLAHVMNLLQISAKKDPERWQITLLEGIGQGLQRRGQSLARLWDNPPAALKGAVRSALPLFGKARKTALDRKQKLADRLVAIRLLQYGPFKTSAPALQELLGPQNPQQMQIEAVKALAEHTQPQVGDILLKEWYSYSPDVRKEAVQALFARQDRLQKLLTALEQKKVQPTQLEPARLALLRKHPNAQISKRAGKVLANLIVPARQNIIKKYQKALELKPNVAQGKKIFTKTCSVCHRLEKIGFETGPDLVAVLPGKSPEYLLTAILDPNREVDPRYLDYIVTTKAGKIINGRIMAETATSITLRRDKNAEDVILRSQIDVIQSTARSLMPEGLEKQLSPQDIADVIGYLRSAVKKK